MMTDSDAQQQNEHRDIEIDELKRRGLWQPPNRGLRPKDHIYRYRRYVTQEEVDRCS